MNNNVNLSKSHRILFLNTLAFTICFACWTMNGVLVTYLVDNDVFDWTVIQTGWLLGIPILSGSLIRLPVGILTDKYGGKVVFTSLLFICAIPLFLLHYVQDYFMYFILSLCFGLVGTSFSVGIAYTSVWYPKNWQGRALGIFGMGNAGAALTTFLAPTILKKLHENDPENGWRMLPVFYGLSLLFIGILFIFIGKNKIVDSDNKNLKHVFKTLKSTRVWRFGLYYFLVFGLFVAFSQWLLPYYINVYKTSLVLGGLLTSLFSLPSGVIRAFGGFLSDKFGARRIMYFVLISSIVLSGLLILPKMEILTPGVGIIAKKKGIISDVQPNKIILDGDEIKIIDKPEIKKTNSILPKSYYWQEIIVKQNQEVKRKELLAEGTTLIQFEANIWVFTIIVFLLGSIWGIGKAAVYKHIPEYFPNDVGVVGGMVGLIGGLGGFFGPIIFGYILNFSGLWTSSWIFVFIISIISYYWMNKVIIKMTHKEAPHIKHKIDN